MQKFNFSSIGKVNRNVKLYITNAAIGFISLSAFGVIQGIYFKELGFSESFIGMLISAKTLAMGLGAIPAGILSDKIGRKKGLVLAILSIFIGGIFQIYSKSPLVIISAAAIFGFGHAIKQTTEGPFLAANSTPDQRITLFSMNFALKNLATVFGNFSSGFVSDRLEISMGSLNAMALTMMIFTVMSVFAIIPVLMIREDRTSRVSSRESIYKGFYNLLKRVKVVKLLAYNSLIGFGAGLVVPFFNIYLKETLGASKTEVGSIMSMAQVATIVGVILIPIIARRLGNVATVITCELLSIPFLIIIAFPQNYGIVAVSFFMRSALMNMAHPAVQNLSMELVEDESRVKMSSLIALSNSTARSLGAFGGGYLMENISYNFPYYITSLCYVTATIFFVNVFKGYSIRQYINYIFTGIGIRKQTQNT